MQQYFTGLNKVQKQIRDDVLVLILTSTQTLSELNSEKLWKVDHFSRNYQKI